MSCTWSFAFAAADFGGAEVAWALSVVEAGSRTDELVVNFQFNRTGGRLLSEEPRRHCFPFPLFEVAFVVVWQVGGADGTKWRVFLLRVRREGEG